MKPTIKNLLIISLVSFFIASCGSKSADILVPEDAAMVLHVNAASLSSKISWNDIKSSDWFKMMNSGEASSDIHRKLLEDPAASGIDLNSDFYMFIKPSGNHMYVCFQGKLKDAKAFEEMLKKLDKNVEIKKDGDMNYAGEDDDSYMTWKSDRFIIVGNASGMNPGMNRHSDESKVTPDSILKYAKETYNLKSSNSISGNSKFKSMMAETGDMHMYVTSNLTGGSMAKQLSIFKAGAIMEGNISTVTINFDNGKITGTSKSYFNKELQDFYTKYKAGNLNTEMLKKIPGDNVTAALALNYPPEGIKGFLKLLGLDGMVDGYLNDLGFTIDDFVAANKGDLLLAVTDFGMVEKEKSVDLGGGQVYKQKSNTPDAKILFATSIGNKGSFDKLIAAGTKAMGELGKMGNGSDALNTVKYEIKDNWFVAGNSQEQISAFGTGAGSDKEFINKISGHPFGFYIDLKKIIGGMQTSNDRGMMNMFGGDGKIWDNIIAYGGEMKDGVGESHVEINMVDKNTNSLKQLSNFASGIAKQFSGAMHMSEDDYPKMDSAGVAPPPPVELKPKK
ncbi:MAG: DUF4836 family protein [Bacteroidetes bacterium]|nr:MAG: DUF4836 family protein [Bacteroidota bacterium]